MERSTKASETRIDMSGDIETSLTPIEEPEKGDVVASSPDVSIEIPESPQVVRVGADDGLEFPLKYQDVDEYEEDGEGEEGTNDSVVLQMSFSSVVGQQGHTIGDQTTANLESFDDLIETPPLVQSELKVPPILQENEVKPTLRGQEKEGNDEDLAREDTNEDSSKSAEGSRSKSSDENERHEKTTSEPAQGVDKDDLPWAIYRSRIPEKNSEDFDALSDIISSDEEKYIPASSNDLPDPFDAINTIETDDDELNQSTSPPSILDSGKQNLHNRQVENLKEGLAADEVKLYLDEFEDQVKEHLLMIGNISLSEVLEEERSLQTKHIEQQQHDVRQHQLRQQQILQAMELAKHHVMKKHRKNHQNLKKLEEILKQRDRYYKDKLHREFRRSESQLLKALERRKAEVRTMYGDLVFADGVYGGSQGRRWKVDWSRAPQPIQIRLKCLRGVKDKIPFSRYVIMISLYNRLGGHVMQWSSLKGQQWGGATLPIFHDGDFFNIEMKIDQSVFTVCPSRPDIRPDMVLVFELFILRGTVSSTDKVVGWGSFPICDAEFNILEGKFRTPMLRGDLDSGIDKFETVEKLMATDLENWLCNAYFEIVRLPRYMAGQKEYEVELGFTSGLLGAPDRTRNAGDNIDGEVAVFGSRSDINSSLSRRTSVGTINGGDGTNDRPRSAITNWLHDLRKNSDENINHQKDGGDGLSAPSVRSPDSRMESSRASSARSSDKKSISYSDLRMYRAGNLSADLRRRRVESRQQQHNLTNNAGNDAKERRPMTSVMHSRKLIEEKGIQLSDTDTDDSVITDDEVYPLSKETKFEPVKGEPGLFYKIHYNTPAQVYARKMYTMTPKTELLSRQTLTKTKMSPLEALGLHTFAVKTPWSNKGKIDHKGSKKMQYIGRMLLSELGLSQIKSRTFWAMLLMIVINFWIRLYLHYFGQWLALQGFSIPINMFNVLPYTVELNYQSSLLRTREEIAIILIGPFTCIILFSVLVVLSLFVQVMLDRYPDIISKFIMAFGVHCSLDPVWILLVDSCLYRFQYRGTGYPIGDAFKLYWHFKSFYRNDNVTLFISIALTMFLYFVTIFCAVAILYMYFLRLHNNGRLMDVYWRLHGEEQDFFVPYDLELSHEELSFICTKAEQWRGEEGERRKTAVYDYVWEVEEAPDEDWADPNARAKPPDVGGARGESGRRLGDAEVTTHVSIHTLHLDGLRELYRHFLRLPGGAIVEVFGEMNIPGIDEGIKQALLKKTGFQAMSVSEEVPRPRSSGSTRSKKSSVSTAYRGGKESLTIPTQQGALMGRKRNIVKIPTVEFLDVPSESSM